MEGKETRKEAKCGRRSDQVNHLGLSTSVDAYRSRSEGGGRRKRGAVPQRGAIASWCSIALGHGPMRSRTAHYTPPLLFIGLTSSSLSLSGKRKDEQS